jgi:hypothetical protein
MGHPIHSKCPGELEMGNAEGEPARKYAEPMRCGHCGNIALMEMVTSFHKLQGDGYSEGSYYQEFLKWKLFFVQFAPASMF